SQLAFPPVTAAQIDLLRQGKQSIQDLMAHLVCDKDASTTAGPAAETDRILLFVDQFEEIFTLCTSVSARQSFIDLLLESLRIHSQHPPSIVILLAMRADFMAQALTYRPLTDALQ